MSIRILGGAAKGLALVAPKSSLVRPTSVTLKRKLFDSIQDFSGFEFIDLCCGSGSVGLEALSRGAEKVILVDKNRDSLLASKENLNKFKKYSIAGVGKSKVVKADIIKWLSEFDYESDFNLCIFFDPPYELIELYEEVFKLVSESKSRLKLVMEGCAQKTLPLDQFLEKFPNHSKVFQKGTSYFVIYDFE